MITGKVATALSIILAFSTVILMITGKVATALSIILATSTVILMITGKVAPALSRAGSYHWVLAGS